MKAENKTRLSMIVLEDKPQRKCKIAKAGSDFTHCLFDIFIMLEELRH